MVELADLWPSVCFVSTMTIFLLYLIACLLIEDIWVVLGWCGLGRRKKPTQLSTVQKRKIKEFLETNIDQFKNLLKDLEVQKLKDGDFYLF